MSYLKDREIWLSNVPTGNPPAGYFWKFIQNGKVVVKDSSGNNQIMVATSGSQSITGSLTVTGGITGTATTASYIEYSNVANKPALVSGSSQVTYSGLTGIPSGIVSGSAQISSFGIFATTGSNGFNGSQSITGSLTVSGQVVAQTLNVQQVTSSIVYSSGSNIFGNDVSNTQQFTGSISASGSMSITPGITVTGDGSNDMFKAVRAGNTRFVVKNGVNTVGINTDTVNNPLTVNGGADFSGNVGIGITSPSTKLHVYEAATNSTAYLTVQNNRSRNAAVQTTTTNGSFLAGTSIGTDTFNYQIYDNVAGSARLTISSTGAATFSSSVRAGSWLTVPNNFGLEARNAADTAGRTVIKLNTSNQIEIGSDTDISAIILGTTTERMRITSGGRVGIGTTSPGTLLHVSGYEVANWISTQTNTGTSGHVMYFGYNNGTTTTYGLYIEGGRGNADQLDFAVANKFYVNGDGKVGIGTASPAQRLHVANSSGTVVTYLQSTATNGEASLALEGRNSSGTVRNANFKYDNADILRIGTSSPIDFRFETNDTERMRITSGGIVLIGTTTNGGYRLDVAGTIRSFSASPLVVSMTSDPGVDAIIASRWTSGVGMEMRYFPDFAQGFIDNTYQATPGEVYGDIYFRQNVGGTMTSRMMIQARSGNVGIGTTSPNARLDIGSGDIFVRTGVVASNIIDSYNTTLTLRSNGSTAMFVDSSQRVGIGTTSPSGRLHVRTTGITASSPSNGWPVYNAELDTNARNIYIDTAGNGDVGTAGRGATIVVNLGQYYDSRVVITPSGNGGNSPGDQGTGHGKDLMLKAGTSDNGSGYKGGRLYLNGGMGYGSAYNANGGDILMQVLTGSGNVGIGTSSPTEGLVVSRGALRVTSQALDFTAGTRGISIDTTDGNVGRIYTVTGTGTATDLALGTNNTERLRITTGGIIQNIGGVYDTGGSTTHWIARVRGNDRIIADNTGYVYMPFLTTGSGIDDLGWWASSGSSWTYNGMLMRISSSARYKKNIRDIEIDTSKIYDLRTISYENNENTAVDGLTSFGLLAEDVAEKIPLLATFNNEGLPEGVQYKMLSVLILEELKKLKAENESLKSRIEILEQ